jgi:hypothetical protein
MAEEVEFKLSGDFLTVSKLCESVKNQLLTSSLQKAAAAGDGYISRRLARLCLANRRLVSFPVNWRLDGPRSLIRLFVWKVPVF